MKAAGDTPPSLPGFRRGVRPRRGQQSGSCDPVGSARWGAIGDHTQRGARRDTVCFLCRGVSWGLVRSPEIRKDAAERGCSGTCTAEHRDRGCADWPERLLAQILSVGWFLILSS